jgi:hypothetical protein
MSSVEPVNEACPGLPNSHLLRIERQKISNYLLNLNHPQGSAKARFFKSIGFSEEGEAEFTTALRNHAAQNRVACVISHRYGVKTVVECFLAAPDGRSYCIRSVWNDHLDGQPPRLITAHPVSASD